MACPTGWRKSIADKPTIYAFLTLQLLGGFGMLIILLTAIINSKVKRRSTWYSFCLSWIISPISYGILLLAGQQFNCNPEHILCLTQTALIYAAPALTTATTLSLAVHMLLNFEFITSDTPFDTNYITLALLLILPYCIWSVLLIGVLFYGIENPKTVQRLASEPYCSSATSTWSHITFVVVGILSVTLITIQVRTYKSRRVLRNACGHSFATLLRIMVFIVLGSLMLSAAAGFTFAQSNKREPFDIILSLFPVLAALVFGSQTVKLFHNL
ncbi:hypothetical protein BDQ17DRAFT_410389 [Cyathus striatus]|nr:hypothetical protein BDQ17DRAFT_410389 [Cyathus striatus]